MQQPDISQDEVIRFLADPATHGGCAVERIDTHAASVFLAGDRALKIKRAVKFPFLDYSTLEKRRAACLAELTVNQPFAPEIYHRVLPITRDPQGKLALGGNGNPVEWAVEMRRFDETQTLDHLAGAGRIDAALADALGRAVATAHKQAPKVDGEPWVNALADYIAQNDGAFRDFPDVFAAGEADALTRACRAALARVRPLLLARGRAGLVRRGHGDLHLGNIALIDGAPVLFDAIEFDPLIAAGDVLYDLAFLLMDLVERRLPDAANIVFNRYLIDTQRREDLDALTALPLFLSIRAAVRAKVTAARRARTGRDEWAEIDRVARTYFQLACSLISPSPPVLAAVGGLSGTGKSVLARALAPYVPPAPGAVVLRSDIERKAMFGHAETERLPQSAYQPEATAKVYASLAEKARHVVSAGHSAVVDAVFADPRERAAIAAAAPDGVKFHGLFLVADVGTRVARVGARRADASDADAAVAAHQESYDLGPLDWTRVDASGTPEETLARARAALSR
jgi:aminoglycoside phosphotransferase family enzyme/predicted kinase